MIKGAMKEGWGQGQKGGGAAGGESGRRQQRVKGTGEREGGADVSI